MWSNSKACGPSREGVRPGASGEGGTGPAAHEEWQASAALNRERALTGKLMERVCERENLNRAYDNRLVQGSRSREPFREVC